MFVCRVSVHSVDSSAWLGLVHCGFDSRYFSRADFISVASYVSFVKVCSFVRVYYFGLLSVVLSVIPSAQRWLPGAFSLVLDSQFVYTACL